MQQCRIFTSVLQVIVVKGGIRDEAALEELITGRLLAVGWHLMGLDVIRFYLM